VQTLAKIEKENQGINSNCASKGYRTIHKNDHIKERQQKRKKWSESEGRVKVISQADKSYEITGEGKERTT
jgi:hypothetical protein